eukprot:4580021-Amphidinium_carterae.1
MLVGVDAMYRGIAAKFLNDCKADRHTCGKSDLNGRPRRCAGQELHAHTWSNCQRESEVPQARP